MRSRQPDKKRWPIRLVPFRATWPDGCMPGVLLNISDGGQQRLWKKVQVLEFCSNKGIASLSKVNSPGEICPTRNNESHWEYLNSQDEMCMVGRSFGLVERSCRTFLAKESLSCRARLRRVSLKSSNVQRTFPLIRNWRNF